MVLKTSPFHCFFFEGKETPQEVGSTINVNYIFVIQLESIPGVLMVGSSFIFPFVWQVQNQEDLHFVVPLFRIKKAGE